MEKILKWLFVRSVKRIKNCSKIKSLTCQNNYLNGLRVHGNLRYLLLSSGPNYLQPQKHDKEKVHPLKDVTYLTLSEEQNVHVENNIQSERPQYQTSPQIAWKSFYRWLQTEIIEINDLRIKLKSSQQVNYPNVSENALNRFINSLEATLDNDNFFHLFPAYDGNKSFEELFNIGLIFCGKKTEKKRIGEVSYKDLKNLFCDWKASLKISQAEINKSEENQSEYEREELKIFQATKDKVRNILLIGRTGSGKSTLANVLINKNEEFEEVFKVSARSVSETKNVKTEKFTVDISNDGKEYIDYLVIDTIGFGDTKISDKEVLQLLQDLVPIIGDNGINQIFFVTDGRFTEKEIETYKLLETVIFDKKVVDFTTIVRARFPEFEDREECDEDRRLLWEENEEIFKILKTSKIVYVDNPSLTGRSLVKNKEIREESRKRLLTHLGTCRDIYFPSNLAEFKQRIDDYQTKTEQLEKQLAENEQTIKDQEDKFQNDIQAAHTKQRIDSELSQRKFEQKIKSAKDGHEWKLKYTQEQLEIKYQNQLKTSQQKYEREQNEAELRRQYEVNRIRSEFQDKKVQVGEAVCSQGHNSVQAYNKYGVKPNPDDFNDTIFYVYCSVCGKNDFKCQVRNTTTYNFEGWCKIMN